MLLPREELEKIGVMDPDIADVSLYSYDSSDSSWLIKDQYMVKNPQPPIDFQDYKAMRRGMAAMDNAMNARLCLAPAASEFYHEIQMRDGFMSSLKIHRPEGGPPGPLVVLCFGGGFIGGDNNQLTVYARPLTRLFGATVVNINYRLGPEHKFPIGQLDGWDSMKWIANNATGSVLNSDPSKGFIMGGVSAGGSLTASLSRKFQEEPLAYPLTGQWLSIPPIMDSDSVPEKYKEYYISSEQQAKGKFLSAEAREALRKFTEPDPTDPLRYAVNSKTPLSEQPPTYFQADGMDPLRDDALIYDDMLKEVGVPTKFDLYPGCPHGHFAGFPGLEITDRANIDVIVGFGWLLGKVVPRDQAAKELGL